MDISFHASENDFICEDCGKCLKSRSGLRRHRLTKHLKQEIKFKCTTDSCTAAFCEKGELLAHQTSHGEQKRITCNYLLISISYMMETIPNQKRPFLGLKVHSFTQNMRPFPYIFVMFLS